MFYWQHSIELHVLVDWYSQKPENCKCKTLQNLHHNLCIAMQELTLKRKSHCFCVLKQVFCFFLVFIFLQNQFRNSMLKRGKQWAVSGKEEGRKVLTKRKLIDIFIFQISIFTHIKKAEYEGIPSISISPQSYFHEFISLILKLIQFLIWIKCTK